MGEWKELFQSSSVRSQTQSGLSCSRCGLSNRVNTPCMPSFGEGAKGVLWIGEAPGEEEDRIGRPWQGKAGRYLQRILREFDFDLFKDAVCINSVNCRPPENRAPSSTEIAHCRKYVFQAIQKYKPKVIVLAGASAVESVIGNRWRKGLDGISRWRGVHIPDREFNAWVCPVFHPSYILRSEDEPQIELIFKDDVAQAVSYCSIDMPQVTELTREQDCVQIMQDDNELSKKLTSIVRCQQIIAFDYETSGLKPHADGHKIYCMSIATSENESIVFKMPGKDSVNLQRIKEILADKNISKIAHNMQFEDTWTKVILGVDVQGWEWDSMLAAHVLDNRSGYTGLKFQALINFGLYDYSSEIESYLKGVEGKDANSMNRVDDFINKVPNGEQKLLTYCGVDSLVEYRLAQYQRGLINGL